VCVVDFFFFEKCQIKTPPKISKMLPSLKLLIVCGFEIKKMALKKII